MALKKVKEMGVENSRVTKIERIWQEIMFELELYNVNRIGIKDYFGN